MRDYRIINHTADIGVESYGTTKKALFESTAAGLFDIITDKERVDCRERFSVEVDGLDLEDLLINWLRELLYLHNIKKMLLRKFDIITLRSNLLKAKVCGERFDEARHSIKLEIKAATYHGLKIEKKGGIWVARVIFDV